MSYKLHDSNSGEGIDAFRLYYALNNKLYFLGIPELIRQLD